MQYLLVFLLVHFFSVLNDFVAHIIVEYLFSSFHESQVWNASVSVCAMAVSIPGV